MKYVLIALLLSCPSAIWAQTEIMDDSMPPRDRHERIVEKLNLSKDQQKQFDKLTSDLQKKQIALRSKIQTARVELHSLMQEDSPDRARVEAEQNEISKLQGELKLNHTGFWFDVNKILTPEQQKEWKEHMRMIMAKKGQLRQRGLRPRMHRPGGAHHGERLHRPE